MRKEIRKILFSINTAEILYSNGTIKSIELNQPKRELLNTVKLKIEELNKEINKIKRVIWPANGMVIISALLNVLMANITTIAFPELIGTFLSATAMIGCIITTSFSLLSLKCITERERITANSDEILNKLEVSNLKEITRDYFKYKKLESKKNSKEYNELMNNLEKEISYNKRIYSFVVEQGEPRQEKIKGNPIFAEEVKFEMAEDKVRDKVLSKKLKNFI